MRIFFGKIASKMNPAQFRGGYYETDNPAWFNGVDVGDYVFAISGSEIELWKARSWRADKLRLDFDKILQNLEGKTAKLMAFKYFNLTPALISATTKSLKYRAFIRINLAKPITEAQLTHPDLYKDDNNFRRIKVLEKVSDCDPISEDVQLYYEQGKLNISLASFMEGDTFRHFKDNTDRIGGGRKKKDKTLRTLQSINGLPKDFAIHELNLRNIYEAFAVPYESKKEEEEDDVVSMNIPQIDNHSTMYNHPLNQILYGPPGTGKTYKTLVRALSIVENVDENVLEMESRDELRARYNEYVKSGQIAFVTFHQSFAYEDFIEGIKPLMSEEIQDNVAQSLEYEIKPGIFKRLCEDAKGFLNINSESSNGVLKLTEKELEAADFYKMSLGDSQDPRDQQIFEYCLENDCVAMGWGREINFTNAKNEIEIKQLYHEVGKDVQASDYGVFAVKCLKHSMKEGDLILIPKGNFTIRAIAKVTGDYYFDPNSPIGYNQFRKVQWVAKDLKIPVQQVYSKRFSMQTIYGLYSNEIKLDFLKNLLKKEKPKTPNYVLIIDEINRGNVSTIFGELITLIEEDKRLGKKEALEVKLPYSKDELFGVPPNLYIIGTMNTADRSVEALDTALRRRFSFEHMPPRYNLDELQHEVVPGVKVVDIVKTINTRIEKLLDSDHQIGHSYFLSVRSMEQLREVFHRNIIPLLQEYFFGDYGKIGLVLGSGFVRIKPVDADFANFDYTGLPELKEREVFEIVKHETMEDFKAAIRMIGIHGSKLTS